MRANEGRVMAELLYPTDGYRGSLSRRGIKPKDHSKLNRRSLKDLESTIQERLNRPPTTPSMWKSKKFEAVSSRVFTRPTSAPPPKSYENIPPKELHPDYGKVPDYLLEIKQSLAEVKAQKNKQESQKNWPEGMRLLEESERLEILNKLRQEREIAWRALNGLPFTSDSLAVKRKRTQLELKLKELEIASARYSTPKVFVNA
mmetsp:Transcript_3637/g.7813  ORF Transcript_3637/g.7813 Transcript_3637/m.7813 type:complete len:202 (-) Transcript_3637:17-622(-)